MGRGACQITATAGNQLRRRGRGSRRTSGWTPQLVLLCDAATDQEPDTGFITLVDPRDGCELVAVPIELDEEARLSELRQSGDEPAFFTQVAAIVERAGVPAPSVREWGIGSAELSTDWDQMVAMAAETMKAIAVGDRS